MSWKKFKNVFKTEKILESQFILGIDLGNATSAIAFFDAHRNMAELIDISGGYGKPTLPTVLQYISESKEWVFGEYAILNKGFGKEITLSSLIDKLGKREYLEIDKKPMSVIHILSFFLKELIGNVKNLNPNSEIAGIIVSIPSYFSEESKEELLLSFQAAGYEKDVIELVPDRECIFNKYYYQKDEIHEKVLLLDFGSRELRGGVYDIDIDKDNLKIKSISSLFEESLGTENISDEVNDLFTKYYCETLNTVKENIDFQTKEQIHAFAYQHKDLLFQKNILQKPLKLYFNFAYPPFQKTITKDTVSELSEPYKKGFLLFIEAVLEKKLEDTSGKIKAENIDTVLCTGGGFEMLWAREAVLSLFNEGQTVFLKNAKGVIAEGAAILAASKLGVIKGVNLVTEDKHQITLDIGLTATKESKERFIPIVERNSFWWQRHKQKIIIINEQTNKPVSIPIFTRDSHGNIELLNSLILEELPLRPKGTTRISITFIFKTNTHILVEIKDYGFGEIFPKTDYKKLFALEI